VQQGVTAKGTGTTGAGEGTGEEAALVAESKAAQVSERRRKELATERNRVATAARFT
jgi:hypothetical protein